LTLIVLVEKCYPRADYTGDYIVIVRFDSLAIFVMYKNNEAIATEK